MLKITYVYYLQWIVMQYSNYTVKLFILSVCDWLTCVELFYSCTVMDACYSLHIMLMYLLYNVFLLMLTIPISKFGLPKWSMECEI